MRLGYADLELEPDAERARTQAEHVWHELAEVQLNAVERQIAKLRKRALAESAIAIGTLAATVVTGGLSLIGTGLAVSALAKTMAEYDAAIIANPAYFLWHVKQARR